LGYLSILSLQLSCELFAPNILSSKVWRKFVPDGNLTTVWLSKGKVKVDLYSASSWSHL